MRVRRLLLVLVAVAPAILSLAPGALADKQVQAQPVDRFTGDVTMDQGENLTFMNADSATHNVTADTNGSDGQPLFASMDTTTRQTTAVAGAQFLTTGDYKFHCSVHPFMTGTLHVTANGTPKPRTPDNPAPNPADTTPPAARGTILDSRISGVLEHRGLRVRVKTDEPARFRLTATSGK